MYKNKRKGVNTDILHNLYSQIIFAFKLNYNKLHYIKSNKLS